MSSPVRSTPSLRSVKPLLPLIVMAFLLLPAVSAYSQTTTCFSYDGTIQMWTVPDGVTSITIEAWGAQGGDSTWGATISGGLGAYMSGTFAVTPGDQLKILVGGQGETSTIGGGGGGSFVATITDVPLLVAGGGGGASSDQPGVDAVTTEAGTADSVGAVAGGTAGSGGNACDLNNNSGGGGGGFYTDGADATDGISGNGGFGGIAFVNGGTIVPGGRLDGLCTADPAGGFGGGGSATCNTVGGGGGGGYSGGAGGQMLNACISAPRAGGGGGGSLNNGTDQTNTAGVQTGNGQVCVTYGLAAAGAIPTLNEWGLTLLGLLIGLAGILVYRLRA